MSDQTREQRIVQTFLDNCYSLSTGAKWSIVGRPDREERNKKAVDFLCRCETNGRLVALELTTALRERESGHETAVWRRVVGSLEEEVAGRVRGTFQASTPIRVEVRGLEDSVLNQPLRDAIIEGTAAMRVGEAKRLSPHGVPFFVDLYKLSGEGSKVFFGRYLHHRPEEKDLTEFLTAVLRKKAEKLAAAHASGSHTLLLLENREWTAVKPWDLYQSLKKVARAVYLQADELFVIELDRADRIFGVAWMLLKEDYTNIHHAMGFPDSLSERVVPLE